MDISLTFDSLDNMRITYSESKDNLGRSGKGLITSMCLNSKARSKKYKRASYSIRNFSKKDFPKIIREFDKLPYKSYDRKRPNHEPTDSYFYLARHIAKCMMRDDALNSHVYPVITEVTATKQIPTLHVCSTEESKLKEFLVDENLLHICSTEEEEPKDIIFNKCSAEEDES